LNSWSIPDWLEREVVERDRHCVYCGIEFVRVPPSRGCKPSWEHIVNDARLVSRDNIARCCIACNSSKGQKDLGDWLQSNYCRRQRITETSVAEVVKLALARQGVA